MNKEPINLNEIPYTQWLEETLQNIVKLPVKGIALNVVLADGSLYTDYYKLSMNNKLTIAGLIQQDAMYDSLRINGLIKDADEEDESDGEEE